MKTTQRTTAFATALLAPAFAMAHTGSDGGGHHNFLDALLYALSDLSLPAMTVALGIWGAIFAASRNAKRRRQQVTRRNDLRNRP